MSKCLCIIPARSGSKRIKNKNIIKLNGKPLIYYTIQFAKKLNFVDEIIFSSDSRRYLNLAKKYKINNLSLRPKKISSDNSRTIDVVKYEINKIKKYDYILLLQPTTPFRDIKDFKKAYRILINNKCDSVITVNLVNNFHPYRMKIFKGNILKNFMNLKKENFKAVKHLPKVFVRSGSMYFFKRENISKYNSILGKKTYGIEVKGKNTINIDEKEDLILAKHFFKRN
mgnify:CR=1 FL=1